ncbi:suppressor of actin-like [Tropilaelaps mercedesae]|uniref:Suppressor of actin-like n=1 Tax=Tropilaelaps mercedesae TaxID=418985 RepID=A0A1V9XZ09_9ACAR|nr:suppressor of actin-like [Tropilaelaps mercedesae]
MLDPAVLREQCGFAKGSVRQLKAVKYEEVPGSGGSIGIELKTIATARVQVNVLTLYQRHRMSLNASKEALCVVPSVHVHQAISGGGTGAQAKYTSQANSERVVSSVHCASISKSTDTLDGSGTRELKGVDFYVSGRYVSFEAGKPSKLRQTQQQQPNNLSTSHLSVILQEPHAMDIEGRIKTSHSESALTSSGTLGVGEGAGPLKSPSTPIHIIKKDLVLSPLSKIAKGVQSFGQSVLLAKSPSRQSVAGGTVGLSDMTIEEAAVLARRKAICKSLIIEV